MISRERKIIGYSVRNMLLELLTSFIRKEGYLKGKAHVLAAGYFYMNIGARKQKLI